MVEPEIYWEGLSGKKYGYWIHPIGTTFINSPGNYIYSKETQPGYWQPIYIGQTNSLETRLTSHEKESCAIRHGATHIHTHTSSTNEAIRINEETDLIKKGFLIVMIEFNPFLE